MRILVVEDDAETAAYVSNGFAEEGHSAETVADGRDGLTQAMDEVYDILVIDRMLPGLDGLSLVRALRAVGHKVPVIFLTSLGGVDDRVDGLNVGGDDYLVKPFAFSELMARVNALARRPHLRDAETILRVGDLEMDLIARKVIRGARCDRPATARVPPARGVDAQQGPGADAHDAARAGVELPFRAEDQRSRDAHLAAAHQDRPAVRPRADPHCARQRLHNA